MQSRLGTSGPRLPSLGSVNLALLSLYFIPVWGRDALRALVSPYNGLDDRAQAIGAMFFRRLFGLDYGGVVLVSHVLAGIKLVIAAAFVSYLIEFARAWVMRREADRETIDVVLILAVADIALSMLPASALGDTMLVQLYSTQMLLVAGATTVVVVERHLAPDAPGEAATASDGGALARPVGVLAADPPPAPAATAFARIPEARLRAG